MKSLKSVFTKFLIAFSIVTFTFAAQAASADEITKTGLLKQTIMTNFPWFIITIVDPVTGDGEKYSLNIETANLTSEEFVALIHKNVSFTMNPTPEAQLYEVALDDEDILKLEPFDTGWKSVMGILHVREKSVSIERPNGEMLELSSWRLDKLAKADNKNVMAYYESWMEANISQFGAAK